MAGSYKIDCVELSTVEKPWRHGHITKVHVGEYAWGVSAVRKWIVEEGDRFYTVSPSTGKQADVEPYDCACGVKTIRSDPDHVTDNNLDNMEC